MPSIREIEKAIDELPRDQVFALGEWLQARIDEEWERQFESDVHSGRLDQVARRALEEHRAGGSSDFPGDEE